MKDKFIYKIKSYVIVILFIIIISSVCINEKVHLIKTPKLKGAIIEKEKPKFSLRGYLKGSYQKDLEEWYNDNFYLRNNFIKLYSRLKFNIFDKSSLPGAIKGKEGMLFEPDYVDEYLGLRKTTSDKDLKKLVHNIDEIRKVCNKFGKEFYLIITPSKAHFYHEYLPERAVREGTLHKDRQGKNRDYYRFLNILNSTDIKYFDSVKYIEDNNKLFNTSLYSKYGTHWTFVTAAKVLNGFIDYINKTSRLDLTNIYVDDVLESNKSFNEEDVDIQSVLNFKSKEKYKFQSPIVKSEKKDTRNMPNIFIEGGSFNWQLIKYLRMNRVVNEMDFMFYKKFVRRYKFQQMINEQVSIDKNNKELSNAYLDRYLPNKDMIILEVNQTALNNMGEGFIEIFKDYMNTKGFPKYEYIKNFESASTPEDLTYKSTGFFTVNKDENGYYNWMSDEGIVQLKNSKIEENGINIKTYIPLDYLKKSSNNPQLDVYVNGKLVYKVPINKSGIYNINIDKNKLNISKDHLYKIDLKMNSAFRFCDVDKSQGKGKKNDNHWLSMKVYYIGEGR